MNRLRPDTQEQAVSGMFPERLKGLFRKVLVLIPLGIIANVLWCLATSDRQAIGSLLHVHPGYLGVAALFSIVPWFTGSLRLFTWTRFLKQPVRYRDALAIAVTADLGAAIAPPLIGGGAVKIGMLMKKGLGAGTALSLPVLENMEDALFFLFLVPLAFLPASLQDLAGFFAQSLFPLPAGQVGGSFGVLAGTLLLAAGTGVAMLPRFRERTRAAVTSFMRTFRLVGGKGKKILALTLLLTAVQWICRYSIVSLLLAGLGIPVQPILFMMLQVLVFALTILVPTPGGIGGAEFLFSILYSPFLPPAAVGIVTSLWRLFTFYLHSLLAAVSVLVLARIGRSADSTAAAGDALPSFTIEEELRFVRE